MKQNLVYFSHYVTNIVLVITAECDNALNYTQCFLKKENILWKMIEHIKLPNGGSPLLLTLIISLPASNFLLACLLQEIQTPCLYSQGLTKTSYYLYFSTWP